MVEATPIDKYGLERVMCSYDEDRVNYSYGFDSSSPDSPSTISPFSRGSSSDDGQISAFPTLDGIDVKMQQLRKSVNKLGGMYTSGKPLPLSIRREIVAMSETGMKACDISRQLQISHGCVSKIIAKWRSTGSFEPRRIGGSKPKKTLPEVVAAVRIYKRACPSIHSLEIRKRLLADDICTDQNVPSLSSINRIIRMKLRDEVAEFEASAVRDLMAILTSPASEEMDSKFSPSVGDRKVKREDSFEDAGECGSAPSIPSSQPCPSTAPVQQPVNSLPVTASVEKACARPGLVSYFATLCPQIGLSQLLEPTAHNPMRIEERRPNNPRVQDLFVDPYDCSLGTPIFNEPNAETNHQLPEPEVRSCDAGMVFSFDFEENVWSWLDQMPLP